MADPAVAIVGMAARFPGAPDLETYWQNLRMGFDAIVEAPPDRLDPAFYDPSASAPDRLYCRRGGFLPSPLAFDAAGFGIMPVAALGAEPDQLLALDVAASALADAGHADRPVERDRASVILGRGGYLTAGVARLAERVRGAELLARSLRALVPGITEAQLAAVKADLTEGLGPYGADTAIGLVPNLAASRIANRLDLRGGAYTIDAACASSLVAVDHACRDLSSGIADLVVAGGVHLCHDPTFYSVFCQLGALSRTESIRPFDARADGLLIGEGVGMVVLERLADAERLGHRVYAVIRGTGISSDGRAASLMTPAIEGQLLALRRAWDRAAIDPATIGLVEAHGTGTPAGDAAELTTLARFFGPADTRSRRAALGSVKSMIGHAMPAAGVAGLVKAALAVFHGTLLPTLHCDDPRPELGATRFRTLAKSEPWEPEGALPRRAAVNAFGFGGVNAHVVLEGHAPSRHTRVASSVAVASEPEEGLLFLATPDPESLLAALDSAALHGAPDPDVTHERGSCRVAIVGPTPEKLARARAIIARGEPWRGKGDVWFTPRGLVDEGGKVAFLFPGVDASFTPRVDDVARAFARPIELPASTTSLKDLGMGIVSVGRLFEGVLADLGVRPDMIAGHSIGEWSGMLASELIPRGDVDSIIASLVPENVEVPGVAFVAAGCDIERAERAIFGLDSIAISHDNCPHQVLLCGKDESADIALDRLTKDGVLCQKLPFRSGYHSPLFASFLETPQRVISRVPLAVPRVPLWSATTCAPYPDDPEAVRRLAADHLVRPVRFRELTLAMYERGARVFVQVGTGSLVGFVGDTLRAKPHLAMSANIPARSGMAQLRRLVAALAVEGVPLDLGRLTTRVTASRGGDGPRGDPGLAESRSPLSRHAPAPADPARADRAERRAPPLEISLSAPIFQPTQPLDIAAPLSLTAPFDPTVDPGDPLAVELAASLRELTSAQDEIFRALQQARGPAHPTQREMVTVREMSVDRYPALVDHSFYRQRLPWPNMEDRYPVVPMTMLLSLMMDVARELVPERIPVGLERVRALRWLAVAPPVEITLTARFDGESKVEVIIDGYASGIVEMASVYPAPPRPDTGPLERETPARIDATELYEGRWMFHGPAYQGVTHLGPLGKDGIRGALVSLAAKGGLLDNAGQLLGYWVMQNATVDRLAMPVLLERVRFFSPDPPPDERVECCVRIREMDESLVRADVELTRAGRVYCRIEGWEDRRFDSDDRVWNVLMFPEKNLLTEMRPEGYGLLRPPWRNAASRDLMARRYLTEKERRDQQKVGPRGKAEWLLGRIAIKDCVRRLLWDRGHGPLFPAEIEIDAEQNPLFPMNSRRIEVGGTWSVSIGTTASRSRRSLCAAACSGWLRGTSSRYRSANTLSTLAS